MALEEFVYQDLIGGEAKVRVEEHGDSIVVVKMLRKLHKGEYTCLCMLPPLEGDREALMLLSSRLNKDFFLDRLIIHRSKNSIELIAPYALVEVQSWDVAQFLTDLFINKNNDLNND